MTFRPYVHAVPGGPVESVLDEVDALIGSPDDDAADAGVDFLYALKHMYALRGVPARQVPGIHWRPLLRANEYLLSRDAYHHSLLVTQTLHPASTDVRAVLACNGTQPIDQRARLAAQRHARM